MLAFTRRIHSSQSRISSLFLKNLSSTPSANDWGVVLDGQIIKNADYQANQAQMDTFTADLCATVEKAMHGGGAKAISKHKARGKLLARERINLLVDQGTPFLELSPLAAHDMYGGGVNSAGIITGIGKVKG